MKRLTPLILKSGYWLPIEDLINDMFWQIFYEPILKTFKKRNLQLMNSDEILREAIQSGRIYFDRGSFYGNFNAKISKELLKIGAKFNKRSSSWFVPGGNLPAAVSMAIADMQINMRYATDEILQAINQMPQAVEQHVTSERIQPRYEAAINKMDNAFNETVQSVTIAPKLTEASMKLLAKEYSNNLQLYIKKWSNENILKLRQEIESGIFSGARANSLESAIQKNYEVSKNKAKFLARQETSLLLSKFRENRYKEIGSLKYEWSGSMDERERHDHKILEGKIFLWSNPPITNRETGEKNNPGEDFNCRCVAIPLMPDE